MSRKLLTADEFRSSARDDSDALGTIMRVAVSEPEAAAGDRKMRFMFSDGTVDRSGDSIDPAGWQTATFMDNPVALWAHDSYSPPIGRASNVGVVGSKLMGDIEFMAADISPFADSIYRMVKAGFVRAVSVGFIPLKWAFTNDKDRPYGIDFLKQELLEISVCPVPCNPNALSDAKAMGIDTGPLREWASKLLDEGSCVLVPRNLLEETFRQAKTPRTVRQKYLAKSKTPEWKVGAARDLPVDEKDEWDGAAAAKRMLDAAGFDGDAPDTEKAAKGFLIHDAANPLLRGSYKLPFADVVDGKLTAIKGGVSAAKGRLDQADAPGDVLDEASAVVDAYEKKMAQGKSAPAGQIKAGRAISAANAELLQKAMDYHASATECIKTVLAGSAPDDGDGADDEPDNDPDDKPVVITVEPAKTLTEAEKRAQRIAEAKALRAAAKV